MALFTRDQLYGKRNTKYTKHLFHEFNPEGGLLNLSNEPKNDSIPLRSIFIPMVAKDPTEVEFAEYVFGDYEFWEYLQRRSVSWIGPYLDDWRMKADVKRKSMAFNVIMQELQEGKSSYQAAKYLIEEPWKVKDSEDKRATRKKVRETAEQAFEESGVSEDLKRLRENGLIQ